MHALRGRGASERQSMRAGLAGDTGWTDGIGRKVSSERSTGRTGGTTDMAKDGGTSGSGTDLFARVRARLKAAVGEDVFNSWFARLELEETIDDLAHLSVPTRFLAAWIQSNYADQHPRGLPGRDQGDQAPPFHRPGQRRRPRPTAHDQHRTGRNDARAARRPRQRAARSARPRCRAAMRCRARRSIRA